MMRSLIAIRFRSIWSGITSASAGQKAKAGKKASSGVGKTILFAFLFLYLAVVIGGVMCMVFSTLATAYHSAGLDWLYFAIAGVMALAFTILGSVFATQNQLYDAKDNEFLLSMPIPPRTILTSRMVPLMALNLLYSGIVMVPAIVMYAIFVEVTPAILLQVLSWPFLCLLAQAIACVLGWLLHLLLQRANKSVVSVVYTVLFLGVYFYIYSEAQAILASVAAAGDAIAGAMRTWIWPLYAMGMGSAGKWGYGLIFFGICIVLFAAVCYVLSATFISSATHTFSPKKRRVNMAGGKVQSPEGAIIRKELRKFVGTPVYLTNMGLGLIMIPLLPIAALIFRGKLMEFMAELYFLKDYIPLLICAAIAYVSSVTCISVPSVSLEGKNIWILKSMPVSPHDILKGKLNTHLLLCTPLTGISAFALALILDCDPVSTVLCLLVCTLLSVLIGVFGLWAGLHWAKLDYINEAYPCKQSAAILVTMFGAMGIPFILALAYIFLLSFLPAKLFLIICGLILLLLSWLFHHRVFTAGIRKWESL